MSDCAAGGSVQSTGGAGGDAQSSGGSGGFADTNGGGGIGGSNDADCEVRLPSAEQQYALWPMPTHPDLGLPHPSSYLSDEEGTLLDEVTGLMWQVAHPESGITAADAIDACATLELSGYCDWRVPSRVEVSSLMDSEPDPPLHALIPDGSYLGAGWGLGNSIWFTSSEGGFSKLKRQSESEDIGWVRCVRVHHPPQVAPRSLTIQGNGDDRVVYDAATKLSWKYFDPVAEVPRDEAEPFCQGITAAGGGFRLASVKEVMTIFEEARPETEHIDPAFFPLRVIAWDKVAWTTPLDIEKAGWLFNFTISSSYQLAGQVSVNSKDDHPVFCVK